MTAPEKPLTAAQERFCAEFVANGGNQAAAARVAYPRGRVATSSQAASERGRQLLRRSHVVARIVELGSLPKEPPDTAELEKAAAIAFDDRAPDLVRLIALRTVSEGLRRWQTVYCGPATGARIVVNLRVDGGTAKPTQG